MGESAKDVVVGANPDGLVWTAAEVVVFESLFGLGVNDRVGFGVAGAGAERITRGSRVVGVGWNDVCMVLDWSGVHRFGAGSAVVGMRCGGATLGVDAALDGMVCAWDWIGVRRCSAGSAVVGMRCGGTTPRADAGVCIMSAGCSCAEGEFCTWERCTL